MLASSDITSGIDNMSISDIESKIDNILQTIENLYYSDHITNRQLAQLDYDYNRFAELSYLINYKCQNDLNTIDLLRGKILQGLSDIEMRNNGKLRFAEDIDPELKEFAEKLHTYKTAIDISLSKFLDLIDNVDIYSLKPKRIECVGFVYTPKNTEFIDNIVTNVCKIMELECIRLGQLEYEINHGRLIICLTNIRTGRILPIQLHCDNEFCQSRAKIILQISENSKCASLVHELGHSIHFLVEKNKYKFQSACLREVNLGEFPSLFMEKIYNHYYSEINRECLGNYFDYLFQFHYYLATCEHALIDDQYQDTIDCDLNRIFSYFPSEKFSHRVRISSEKVASSYVINDYASKVALDWVKSGTLSLMDIRSCLESPKSLRKLFDSLISDVARVGTS